MDEGNSLGQRIARCRRRRGLTQEALAGLVGRSTSWLTKVERGELIVDKISVLAAIADVLKIDLGYLLGGVRVSRNGGDPHDSPAGIHALTCALFAVCPPDREPPEVTGLRAGVERAGQLVGNGSYKAAAIIVPELVVDARVAVAQEIPDASWCLAAAYHVASRLARDVGERELALLTADRAGGAARESSDQLLVAASARDLAFALLRKGLRDEAGAVCSNAADLIAPSDASPVAGWSLWGSLQLTGAVICARAEDAGNARRLLADARIAAERVGPGRNDYWEAFGPANVGAHEVAVALELGDPVEALRLADHVEVDELPVPERRAHVLIDIARAHALRHNDAATVALLGEAVAHSPEDVCYSVKAREMVRVCLRRERKSYTPRLRELAQRLGVAD